MKQDTDNYDEEGFRIYDFDPTDEFYTEETAEVYNPYFRLDIGYSIILEEYDEEEDIHILLNITVQDYKEPLYFDEIMIETRVVTEEEYEDGILIERSENYFALHVETNDVIYFGEYSEEYENGEISTEGSWRADDPDNLPGIIMPGDFVKHDKYYQEYAPDIAEDRAENIKHNKNVKTDLGKFKRCVVVEESTPLEPGEFEYKIYAPGVGIIADEDLFITSYGYVNV
jgi:hypothetical protein